MGGSREIRSPTQRDFGSVLVMRVSVYRLMCPPVRAGLVAGDVTGGGAAFGPAVLWAI